MPLPPILRGCVTERRRGHGGTARRSEGRGSLFSRGQPSSDTICCRVSSTELRRPFRRYQVSSIVRVLSNLGPRFTARDLCCSRGAAVGFRTDPRHRSPTDSALLVTRNCEVWNGACRYFPLKDREHRRGYFRVLFRQNQNHKRRLLLWCAGYGCTSVFVDVINSKVAKQRPESLHTLNSSGP